MSLSFRCGGPQRPASWSAGGSHPGPCLSLLPGGPPEDGPPVVAPAGQAVAVKVVQTVATCSAGAPASSSASRTRTTALSASSPTSSTSAACFHALDEEAATVLRAPEVDVHPRWTSAWTSGDWPCPRAQPARARVAWMYADDPAEPDPPLRRRNWTADSARAETSC